MEDNILDADLREENANQKRYAEFGTRFLATLVDALVSIPFVILIVLNHIYLKSLALDFLLSILLLCYKPFFEFKFNATIGKMALKIKVLTEEFEGISLGTSILRNLIYILPAIVDLYYNLLFFNHPEYEHINSFLEYGELGDQVSNPTNSYFGLLMIIFGLAVIFTHKKQGLHDLMVNTVCVHRAD